MTTTKRELEKALRTERRERDRMRAAVVAHTRSQRTLAAAMTKAERELARAVGGRGRAR